MHYGYLWGVFCEPCVKSRLLCLHWDVTVCYDALTLGKQLTRFRMLNIKWKLLNRNRKYRTAGHLIILILRNRAVPFWATWGYVPDSGMRWWQLNSVTHAFWGLIERPLASQLESFRDHHPVSVLTLILTQQNIHPESWLHLQSRPSSRPLGYRNSWLLLTIYFKL